MKNQTAIIGTAGHIDHGKTALIRALTGFDCDTHKQEKQRGITISLGFARLDLADGRRIGIIDCPGHRDFVHTMIAGASGIDLALIAVDASEGIMPQTTEHLLILDLLGIHHRIFAITRCDIARGDDLQELLESKYACPVVQTSAVTGMGIDRLRSLIQSNIPDASPTDPDTLFRMPIDRVFSLPGHGTVVTGTVRSGVLSASDTAILLPKGKRLRIRRMEHFGEPVETIHAGQRAALNITGVKREELHIGMQLAGDAIPASVRIDARLRLFEDAGELDVWSRALFMQNGVRMPIDIHLLDRDTLLPGEQGLVQIEFDPPTISLYGEPFVLRDSSDTYTIGGGTVLDPHPMHHRRRRKHQVAALKALAVGGRKEFVIQKAKGSHGCFDTARFARENGFCPKFVAGTLDAHPSFVCLDQGSKYLSLERHREVEEQIVRRLQNEKSIPHAELAGNEPDFEYALRTLHEAGRIDERGGCWFVSIEPSALRHACDCLVGYMLRENREIVVKQGILLEMEEEGIDENLLRVALDHLRKEGEIFQHRECYLHRALLESAIGIVRRLGRFSVREFRDAMRCSRSTAIAILEYLDDTGRTRREDDVRSICD